MNLSLVLTPVAKADAAGAESATTESATWVLIAPTLMGSRERASPLNHRAKVYCSPEQPSAMRTMTFFALFSARAAEQRAKLNTRIIATRADLFFSRRRSLSTTSFLLYRNVSYGSRLLIPGNRLPILCLIVPLTVLNFVRSFEKKFR